MRNTPAAELLDGTEKGQLKVRVATYLNRKHPTDSPDLQDIVKDLVRVFALTEEEATELAQEWIG
jgi:hypothetical protein